jgi:signal transduction histidine kinase
MLRVPVEPRVSESSVTERTLNLRIGLAALLVTAFTIWVVAVVLSAGSNRDAVALRAGWLGSLRADLLTLQVEDPEAPQVAEALVSIRELSAQVQAAPEVVPDSGVHDAVAQLDASAAELQRELFNDARRTQARTALIVDSYDAMVAIRVETRALSIELNKKWQVVQGIAIASIAVAGAFVLLLAQLRRRTLAAEALGQRLEIALGEAEIAQRRAQRASQVKSDFLATVSHEIRTPLTAILGTTELLADSRLDLGQREALTVIQSGGDTLLHVINDVLDLSRIEAGKLELADQPFDPLEVLESVVLLFAGSAQSKGLSLGLIAQSAIPARVHGDAGRLQQVLSNLIGNAVKFTESGMVQVRAAWRDARLWVEVEDTGPGIPEAQRRRIFESFSQVDGSSTRQHGGTGLGLAIASRLVEAMGGELDVSSEVDLGSTFRFNVRPRKLTPAAPVPKGPGVLVVGESQELEWVVEQLTAWGADHARVSAWTEADLQGRALVILHTGPAPSFRPGRRTVRLLQPHNATQLAGADASLTLPVRPGRVRQVLLDESTGTQPLPVVDALDGSRRVLVVDDHEINRDVLRQLLGALGCAVEQADSGQSALGRSDQRFDLILMDVDMPDMDGLETTRRMREAGVRVPIVGLSGHATSDARDRGMDAGMDDYLTKPVRLATLRATLERWVVEPVD